MNYPKEFFEISLCFAQKVMVFSKTPLQSTLLHYTNLYIRFELGRDFDAANPIWQEYVGGLHQAKDINDWTYRFYLERQNQVTIKPASSPFGCFSYTILDDGRIRLHFHNNKTSEHGPLSKNRMSQRLDELTTLFAHISQNTESSTRIIGASWLYNLEAYRRLFPPAFLTTAQVSHGDFRYLPLWGQFVDHRGRIKEALATRFLNCLDSQQSLENLDDCFPFQVLHLEAPVQGFCTFYGV